MWRKTCSHCLEDVEDESVEQEGPLGERLGEAEVEHKVEEDALVA